jgi:hypothetical protein
MSAVDLKAVLIDTGPAIRRRSIDARFLAWIRHRPTDAILLLGWVLFAVYLAVYFASGAWRMPS